MKIMWDLWKQLFTSVGNNHAPLNEYDINRHIVCSGDLND